MTKQSVCFIIVLVSFRCESVCSKEEIGVAAMNRKSVAVLDVGSSAVTVLIGERGVNNTFVFKGVHTEKYDGFADAHFFDVKDVQRAVATALSEAERSCSDTIKELYVGVPGEFCKVVTRRYSISFQNKRKVAPYDLNALYEQGLTDVPKGYSLIRQAAVYYVTSDNRRTIDPVGMISDSLEGYLSYFLANEGEFLEIFRNMLAEYGVRKVTFLPTSLAEALYLIPSEKRDESAILLDIGYMSMTFSVVCGNGIVYQSACSAGGGHVAAYVYGEGEDGVPFHVLEAMMAKINLSSKDAGDSVIEYIDRENTYSFPVQELKARIKDGLDLICEVINKCLELCKDRSIDYKPILLTGGGITGIRGAREHLSGRLNKVVEIVAPNLPYYNKAAQSSLLSLLDMALRVKRESSFFHKFFKTIGG